MDPEKMYKQYPAVRKKTMSELIADKHKKNQQELNTLRKKWMRETECNKRTT
jgi:hypothetical protein